MKVLILLCALLASARLSTALPQLYFTSETYFRSPVQSSVSAEAVTVALASLLRVPSPLPVSLEVAEQVQHATVLFAAGQTACSGTRSH